MITERAAELARRARVASRAIGAADTARKNRVLRRIADSLMSASERILAANALDLAAADLSAPLRDRLTLTPGRLADLAGAVRAIADLPDPVGGIDDLRARPSGITVGRMRVPLGVILIVYESRPNVTIDAAALCLKAGNAVLLRGGRESAQTNAAFGEILSEALQSEGLADAAILVEPGDRELLYALLGRAGEIDLAIPRGGTSLIEAVNAHARIPVIQHYQGICHVYVHQSADPDVAERIIVNAKTQRPGVCNAMEGFVVDAEVAPSLIPRLVDALVARGVEVRGCGRTTALHRSPGLILAKPEDFDTEFLGPVAACAVVDGFEDALGFLARHGSRHTEAIVTRDHEAAMRFLREVDASCVLVNASTRFNDGGELGLGAELGISTTKLHAYGPMGLEELCARKFVVFGKGEVRRNPLEGG